METTTPSRPDETRAPPWHRDPFTLGYIALLLIAFIIGTALAVRALLSHESAPPPPATQTSQQGDEENPVAAALARFHVATRDVARRVRETLHGEPSADAQSRLPARNDPARTYPALAANQIPTAPHVLAVPANATWAYDVAFGPAWQTAGRLNYLTLPAAPGTPPQATMSWTPSRGKTATWNLGVVEAAHPSHANTRFPGFFMHATYLPVELQAGNQLKWEFPWQGGNAPQQANRVRRFEMTVTGWERVRVPAGEFDAARLDGALRYVEGDAVRAEVRYRLWYSPRVKQVVRLVWMGRAPDESGTEMMVELAAHRVP